MWKYFVFLLNLTSHTCVTLPWCYVEIFFFFPFKSTIVYVRHSPLMWQAMYDNPVHMIFLVSDPQSIMLTTWLFQTYACQWNSSQKSDFFFFSSVTTIFSFSLTRCCEHAKHDNAIDTSTFIHSCMTSDNVPGKAWQTNCNYIVLVRMFSGINYCQTLLCFIWAMPTVFTHTSDYIDGSVQKRRNSSVLALTHRYISDYIL